ncbi:hypothetical protein [Neorhodopirellula pilleata]|uniref:Secreted protein n=1 Tax=Neorhodopirellula pilleata TaxID=2714738 RepID=A0A5C6AR22_9BACT|nr:hypothetical protein [Neorhodopirellula pilleata]TWU01516.1 hypothetical protein Pla100_12510 [Neorhodopirellula pilleata]
MMLCTTLMLAVLPSIGLGVVGTEALLDGETSPFSEEDFEGRSFHSRSRKERITIARQSSMTMAALTSPWQYPARIASRARPFGPTRAIEGHRRADGSLAPMRC